jgi:hypothetical protein
MERAPRPVAASLRNQRCLLEKTATSATLDDNEGRPLLLKQGGMADVKVPAEMAIDLGFRKRCRKASESDLEVADDVKPGGRAVARPRLQASVENEKIAGL